MSETSTAPAAPNNYLRVGSLAILLVLAISSTVIITTTQTMGTDFFINWLGTFLMCATPFQIMMAVVWRHEYPGFIAKVAQPAKGLVLTGLFLLAGVVFTPLLLYTFGQGVLSPIYIHLIVLSVPTSLFVLIVFGSWPVSQFTSNPLIVGIGTLIYCYVLNYLIFITFFNYNFFADAPFYAASIAPEGLFHGITALTYAVTAASCLMVFLMFDMWPVVKFCPPDKQPVFGLIATSLILIVAGFVYSIFVGYLGMEPMDYMTRGPVCIIFGAFIVDNMMQFQLFANMQQPVKGVVKSTVCLVCAFVMFLLYEAVAPLISGMNLLGGPENNYAKEVWIATAMLGVTFPTINVISGAFDFWPIKKSS